MNRIVFVLLMTCMSLPMMAGYHKNAKVDKPKKVYLNSKMHIIPVRVRREVPLNFRL